MSASLDEEYASFMEEVEDEDEDLLIVDVAMFREALLSESLLPPDLDEYDFLLRFVKANKLNIENSKKMWLDMLQWRSQSAADCTVEGNKSHASPWLSSSGILDQISSGFMGIRLRLQSLSSSFIKKVSSIGSSELVVTPLDECEQTTTVNSDLFHVLAKRVKDLEEKVPELQKKIDEKEEQLNVALSAIEDLVVIKETDSERINTLEVDLVTLKTAIKKTFDEHLQRQDFLMTHINKQASKRSSWF